MSKDKKNIFEALTEKPFSWYQVARFITIGNVWKFIKLLNNKHNKTENSNIDVVLSCMVAVFAALSKKRDKSSPEFRNAVGLAMYKELMDISQSTPIRVINYGDMLFPESDYIMDKVILEDSWVKVQKMAETSLSECRKANNVYNAQMDGYKKKLKDYTTNVDNDIESKKPIEPQRPLVVPGDKTYKHWEDLLNGKVPFGYKVITLDELKKKFSIEQAEILEEEKSDE